jgi:hypothetical protein
MAFCARWNWQRCHTHNPPKQGFQRRLPSAPRRPTSHQRHPTLGEIHRDQCQWQKGRQHHEPRHLEALYHSGHRRSDSVFSPRIGCARRTTNHPVFFCPANLGADQALNTNLFYDGFGIVG